MYVHDVWNDNVPNNNIPQNIGSVNEDHDVYLAIGKYLSGEATMEDANLFLPGNTANRQAFGEATGIRLPEFVAETHLALLEYNNKQAVRRDFPAVFDNKYLGNGQNKLDLYNVKSYNEHVSSLTGSSGTDAKPVHYKTRNQKLEGFEHPKTYVPFVRKLIELHDRIYEVVVPEFESKYDVQLSEDMYLRSDRKQFKECNRQLREAIANNPALWELFTESQLEEIKNGKTPTGYVWHHDAEPGKMQLVHRDTHEKPVTPEVKKSGVAVENTDKERWLWIGVI